MFNLSYLFHCYILRFFSCSVIFSGSIVTCNRTCLFHMSDFYYMYIDLLYVCCHIKLIFIVHLYLLLVCNTSAIITCLLKTTWHTYIFVLLFVICVLFVIVDLRYAYQLTGFHWYVARKYFDAQSCCNDFIPLQVLIQYCGVCLFYADETFLMSNSEQPILTLPSCQPVRSVIFIFSFNCRKYAA